MVKVGYPLKQGLKPLSLINIASSPTSVKVGYPLKQGLKQYILQH